jgi:hypothetical protein
MILALYGAGALGREFRQIAQESGELIQQKLEHPDEGQGA